MGWSNPRWGSLTGPDADALRNIFQSLKDFLAKPTFDNGISIGNGDDPTYDPVTDTRSEPPLELMTKDNALVLPATVINGQYIRSGNFATGSAGWQIDGDGDAEFNDVTVRGTFQTRNTPNVERIEILSDPELVDGYQANYIKFFSPTSGGSDPYLPGRIFGDLTAGDVGQMYFRPPYADAAAGKAMLGLESDPLTGDTRAYLGGGNLGQPFLEMKGQVTPKEVNFYNADEFDVDGKVRADVFEYHGGGGAGIRMNSGNVLSVTWDGTNIKFYVDGAHVKTL